MRKAKQSPEILAMTGKISAEEYLRRTNRELCGQATRWTDEQRQAKSSQMYASHAKKRKRS